MAQHNFENDNKYHERSVQARKSTLVSVVVNIFLSALQVVVGIFSGSQGLIADGMHSFSDLVADGVVLMANKKSRRPSDHDHHYGHWRYENGASLIIGAMLLLVGGGMLWSAAGHLAQPQTIPPVHSAALWMALVALAVKEGLFRYMLAAARRLNSSLLIANACIAFPLRRRQSTPSSPVKGIWSPASASRWRRQPVSTPGCGYWRIILPRSSRPSASPGRTWTVFTR